MPGLRPRRGAAVDDHRALPLGPAEGDLPRVVAGRAPVLLVRGLVLLVDDDQAQPGQRREHGAPRAQHHVGAPLADAPVLGDPLAGRQTGVPDGDALAQPRAQSAQELGGQGDLGHQHQASAAARAGRLDGLQVHLGLARAGDTVQQQGAPAGVERGGDRGGGRGLLLRRPGRDRGRGGIGAEPVEAGALGRLPRQLDEAGGGHAPQRGEGRARAAAELGRGQLSPARPQDVEDLAPAPAPARARRAGDQAGGRGRPGRRERPAAVRVPAQRALDAGRQHQAQAEGERSLVVAGHPAGQVQELRRERRRGHGAGQRRQAALVRRRAAREHHAEHPPRAQGAGHQRARARDRVERGGHGVVERPVEGARLDQQLDLRRGGPPRLGRGRRRGHPVVRPRRRRSGRPARRRRRCAPT